MITRHTIEDWKSPDYRRETLRQARKDAKASRSRVIIRVGSMRLGWVTRAIVDGRFYVGRVTLVSLLLGACSGGSFNAADSRDSSVRLVGDSGYLLPMSDAHSGMGLDVANLDGQTAHDSGAAEHDAS